MAIDKPFQRDTALQLLYLILLNVILLSETPSKNMTLKKCRSKSNLDSKLCQFLYFICESSLTNFQNCGKFPI